MLMKKLQFRDNFWQNGGSHAHAKKVTDLDRRTVA
jgi:hypothetical protein